MGTKGKIEVKLTGVDGLGRLREFVSQQTGKTLYRAASTPLSSITIEKSHLCPPDFPLSELAGEGLLIAADYWDERDDIRGRWCRQLYEKSGWRTGDPDRPGTYLATLERKRDAVCPMWFDPLTPEGWHHISPDTGQAFSRRVAVIAWRPLPAPYEPPSDQ